jgi:DNA-binding transcriptional MerR regulator
MDETRYRIEDLGERTGFSRRTIRFYIQSGLLEPPAGRGRGGFYGERHLERLLRIRALQDRGLRLNAIRRMLEGGQPPASAPPGATGGRDALPQSRSASLRGTTPGSGSTPAPASRPKVGAEPPAGTRTPLAPLASLAGPSASLGTQTPRPGVGMKTPSGGLRASPEAAGGAQASPLAGTTGASVAPAGGEPAVGREVWVRCPILPGLELHVSRDFEEAQGIRVAQALRVIRSLFAGGIDNEPRRNRQ